MMNNLKIAKNFLRNSFLGSLAKRARDLRVYKGRTRINILETFPAFVANGWGLYSIRARLTIQSINQVIPGLLKISEISRESPVSIRTLDDFVGNDEGDVSTLKELFDKHGSDKASTHDYYRIYAKALPSPSRVSKIFEIGLGTNNTDVVSTMGRRGKPGASLRAFRDYYTSAHIIGADFDQRILFGEDRIQTFFLDQTRIETFDQLAEQIGDGFDLMIDDGLHAPNANLNSLAFFLPRLKAGGIGVIEDISRDAIDIWKLTCAVLPDQYRGEILATKSSLAFVVRRLGLDKELR